jgi:hypothetical protein
MDDHDDDDDPSEKSPLPLESEDVGDSPLSGSRRECRCKSA